MTDSMFSSMPEAGNICFVQQAEEIASERVSGRTEHRRKLRVPDRRNLRTYISLPAALIDMKSQT